MMRVYGEPKRYGSEEKDKCNEDHDNRYDGRTMSHFY
jgi:hypothetical protein